MNKTKSICFGRFMIDIPDGAEIREMGQQSEFAFGEIKSEPYADSAEAFTQKMQQRESQLAGIDENKGRALKNALTLNASTKLFVTSRKIFRRDDLGFEAYKVDKNQFFTLTEKNFEENVFRSEVLPRLQNNLLPNIRARQSDEIPTEPGFCIKNGFIADDGSKEQYERARIQINFKAWPDVWVYVSSMTVHKAGEKTLFQRVDAGPAIPAWAAGKFKTLRRDVREVNGRKGEEMLDLLPTDEGFQEFSFRWEANGAVNKIFAPDLVVELVSASATSSPGGVRRPPTTTNDQAIKLFDSIVGSIRLRPTSAPKVSSSDSRPLLPLGELVATGRACPQPGWWECAEVSAPVQGGNRQFFRGGDVMPYAILMGEPNVWQKLKGEAPTHRVATVWKLVAYDTPAAPAVAPTASIEPQTPSADTDNTAQSDGTDKT